MFHTVSSRVSCICIRHRPISVFKVMDRMISSVPASAPLFMVRPEIMKEVQAELLKTSIPDTLKKVVPAQEKFSDPHDQLLEMLRTTMRATVPPAGHGRGGSTISMGGYQMGLTENAAATYLSSGNRCLDFFFQVVPSTSEEEVLRLISLAWEEDALTALKLIFHLYGVRGTGKADREGFYHTALWLHENHPATLRANVASIAEFGCFKDLLEVVARLLEGPGETRERARKKERLAAYGGFRPPSGLDSNTLASILRKKRDDMARKAASKFYQDSQFQALYSEVAQVFADRLKADIKALEEQRYFDISLAAKWAPSLDHSFDRRTLMCYAIASKIYPKEDNVELAQMCDQWYSYAVRDRLRREVLVLLRKALDLPEIYVCAKRWGDVNYRKVASVAMGRYRDLFQKHDEERFSQYLTDVYAGKEKLAAGALFPHDIVKAAREADFSFDEPSAKVPDLQWKRMVEDLQKLGTLRNCIAICDVSGSMNGTPMCIALGILLSELSEEPWKGNVITFSAEPNIHKIQGKTLREKASFVERMNWGFNTNLQLVFEKILAMAEAQNLPPEKMIKRIFIFSDMEFDQACSGKWETDYDAIVRKFKQHGFGKPPDIVFWNLRQSDSIPVMKSEPGVALVSGFSKNLLKLFLEKDEEISPMIVMNDAISGKEFDALKVID